MNALRGLALVLLVALLAVAGHWANRHYRDAPDGGTVTRDPRLSFAHSAHLAHSARDAYRALSPAEQDSLKRQLAASLSTVAEWTTRMNRQSHDFICLGERHRDAVRRFLARRVLPRLQFDVMMLEADSIWVRQALGAREQGKPVPELLGATMQPVMDALARRHPPVHTIGVDESEFERRARRAISRADLSRRAREDTIVANLRRRWRPGIRHLVLFGALHCRDLPQWFFARLPRESDVVDPRHATNVVLLARYQEPAVQLLMYLLEEMGFQAEAWVVPDTRRFPRLLQEWLPNVTDAFATFDSAIIFDDRASGD